MIKKIFATIVILLVISSFVYAKPLTLNQISEATCRVQVGNDREKSFGSGTCIAKDDSNYYILTNGHVVGNSAEGYVEFFKSGYKTREIPATVIWKAYQKNTDIDFAILSVKKEYFGDYPPRIIPLAPKSYSIKPGYYIASAGCPGARWVKAWEGHAVSNSYDRVVFVPYPIDGQSGSGISVLIKDKNGEWQTKIGAVVTWRIQDNGEDVGGAIPISTFYAIKDNKHSPYQVSTNISECSYKTVNKYALGDNGKVYNVVQENGLDTIRELNGEKPNILTWDYYNSQYCQQGWGIDESNIWGGWRRPSPYPSPSPGPYVVPPGNYPPGGCGPDGCPPNGGGGVPYNPYGVIPPVIGDDGLGGVPGDLVPIEPPVEEPKTNNEQLDKLANDYLALQEKYASEKKELEEKILALDAKMEEERKAEEAKAEEAKAEEAKAEENSGFIGLIKGYLNNVFGGILLFTGVGLLYIIWKKVIRKRVVVKIDSFQDYIEEKAKGLWGEEFSKDIRDLMEGVEESLLGVADDYVDNIKTQRKVLKANNKGKPAEQVKKSLAAKQQVNVSEVLEAVRQASLEVGDDSVTEEMPKKVAEIINNIKQNKNGNV